MTDRVRVCLEAERSVFIAVVPGIAGIVCACGILLGVLAGAHPANAACNLIPAAERTFASTLGSVVDPLATPGRDVTITLDPVCDTAGVFDLTPSQNVVTVHFEPAAGPATDVVIASSEVTVHNPRRLSFVMPDTDDSLAPAADGLGLTGPARITVVRVADNVMVAEIGQLYQPAKQCARVAETVFEQLTVLPPPNIFADLYDGSATTILATLDGGGNLLIPFNYYELLPNGSGSPIARFLAGNTNIDAFTSTPGAPIIAPDGSYVRAFTLDGRPLGPLLRAGADGETLFGTADAVESVIRVQRTDGIDPPIYDLTDRQFADKGPIRIDDFALQVRAAGDLKNIIAADEVVTYARDETEEGIDINGDGDTSDRVVQVIDTASTADFSTNRQVTEVRTEKFSVAALDTDGTRTIFLEVDPAFDNLKVPSNNPNWSGRIRVIDRNNVDLTAGVEVTADPAPRIDGRPLVLSNSLAFFAERNESLPIRFVNSIDITPYELRATGLNQGGTDFYGLSNETAAPEVVYLRRDLETKAIEVAQVLSVADGIAPNAVLDSATLSFDNRNVYAATDSTVNEIYVFSRDDQTGLLSLIQTVTGGGGAQLSVDDRHLYACHEQSVLAPGGVGIYVYARDPSTGMLTPVEYEQGAPAPGDPVFGSCRTVTATLDGTSVYTAGDGLGVLSRDIVTGALTLIQSFPCNQFTGEYCTGVSAVASIDGRFVYYVQASSIRVFARDTATGLLTPAYDYYNRCPFFGENGAICDPSGVSCSNVGLCVFFDGATYSPVSCSDTGVSLCNVDFTCWVPQAGTCIASPGLDGTPCTVDLECCDGFFCGTCDGARPVGVCPTGETCEAGPDPQGWCGRGILNFSPQGTRAYVTSIHLDQLAVFDVDTVTGELTLLQTVKNGVDGVSLVSPVVPGFDPSFTELIVATGVSFGTKTVSTFRIPARLKVFDPDTSSFRTNAEISMTAAATAAGRAAVITPEPDELETDLNSDGDPFDDVAHLYDGQTDTLTNLGVAASKVAISNDLVAIMVPEAQQGNQDRNFDGDTDDDVLAVYEIGAASPVFNVAVAADQIGVTGQTVVFITSEAAQAGTDLNGDGDALDRVLRLYDPVTDSIIELGLAADEFVVSDDVIGVRVPEAAQDNTDLNFDGDMLDSVMFVVDVGLGAIYRTDLAATPCELGGCDPILPYKVSSQGVSFLTYEPEQGNTDLDGDGDALDYVKEDFHLDSQLLQPVAVRFDRGAAALQQFRRKFNKGTLAWIEADEAELNRDISGDGMIGDDVILLAIDTDEDGVLDDFDNCREVANPDQLDSDLDELGDACDLVCTPIIGCTSAVTCTTPSDSQCTSCSTDRYVLDEPTDSCPTCASLNRTIGDGVVCGDCTAGFMGSASGIDACTPIGGTTSTTILSTTTTTTTTTTTSTVPAPVCPPAPSLSCRTAPAGKAKLIIKAKGPGKDSFKWKLAQGDATDKTEFGDPIAEGGSYVLCLYDTSDRPQPHYQAYVESAAAVAVCDGRPCWKENSKGYQYKSKTGNGDGVTKVKLLAGAAGKTKIQAQAKKDNFVVPELPLDFGQVTVELRAAGGGAAPCWQSAFRIPDRNDPTQYVAKSSVPGVCGDGIVQTGLGEDCDTGGESATCDADCTAVVCGDGTANAAAGEACDDAGESAICDSDCTAVVCGDGTANAAAGEACDDAGESATCDDDCTVVSCGDGNANTTAGEECDDGGPSANCSSICRWLFGCCSVNVGVPVCSEGPVTTANLLACQTEGGTWFAGDYCRADGNCGASPSTGECCNAPAPVGGQPNCGEGTFGEANCLLSGGTAYYPSADCVSNGDGTAGCQP